MSSLRMKLFPTLTACLVLLAFGGPADAQTGDLRCTNLCVAIVQSVDDEVKEQIALACVQTTGRCTGQGHFQTGQTQTPVTIEGDLVGNILTLHIRSAEAAFVPVGQNALTMALAADQSQQAAQFVIHERVEGVPFAREDTQLAVTVVVQRLVNPL